MRFNLSESSVLASIGSDRTFTLYDIRTGKAERRVVMQVSSDYYFGYVVCLNISPDAQQLISMVADVPYHIASCV